MSSDWRQLEQLSQYKITTKDVQTIFELWARDELIKYEEDPEVNWLTEEMCITFLENGCSDTRVESFSTDADNCAACITFSGGGGELRLAFECTVIPEGEQEEVCKSHRCCVRMYCKGAAPRPSKLTN